MTFQEWWTSRPCAPDGNKEGQEAAWNAGYAAGANGIAEAVKVAEREGAMQGHGKLCYYCGQPCDSLAGNPSLWPVAMCHADDPGRVKWHHVGCVEVRVSYAEKLQKPAESLVNAMTRWLADDADVRFEVVHDAYRALRDTLAALSIPSTAPSRLACSLCRHRPYMPDETKVGDKCSVCDGIYIVVDEAVNAIDPAIDPYAVCRHCRYSWQVHGGEKNQCPPYNATTHFEAESGNGVSRHFDDCMACRGGVPLMNWPSPCPRCGGSGKELQSGNSQGNPT